jgi:hypothetical protein
MTVEVADSHVHLQRLVSVVKMATVLEECSSEEQRSVLLFLCAKGLNVKDIHKEIFCVYSVCHKWVEKFSQRRSKI